MSHQLTVTWQHMRRSPYQAAAAIMIMTFTLYMALFFSLLSLAGHAVIGYLEARPPVIAFFKDTVQNEDQVKPIIDELTATNRQFNAKFVSKEEALKIYRDKNQSDPLLLELVTANILPSSLEISAKSLSDLPVFYDILKKAPDIEEISYQQDIIKTLTTAFDRVRREGLIMVSFLILTSLLTIITVIGMKISLRKDEIIVQRLVGASKWFIRSPFLLEGFFYGVFGALLAWSVICLRIFLETPNLLPYLGGTGLLPVSPIFVLQLLAISAIAGGAVGMLGSFLAVWRYLKD
ncbi:MAG: Cell division protein FtsX [Microgenomates group bacterium GW2011_GWA1_48_10]|nr:MAG: Cell division protein FtsX [Microgenomates group bacterium GW2011_GWA1_48_10]